jgi:RimJ/RimL family protein N-acetyltransferase
MLGFETVSAGADRENTASLAMLERLGFRAREERQGQIFYLLQKEAFLHNSLGEKAGGQT